jgi:hypothetical protein
MYELVQVVNSTNYPARGKVEYLTKLCSDDEYTVNPFSTWTANHRGVCLVTKISALLAAPSGPIEATPYTSSGTGYSQFAVIQWGSNSFRVTRITGE